MTLVEAIKRAEEVAEEMEKMAKEWHENQVRKCELLRNMHQEAFAEMDYTHENECKNCGEEHQQIAEWLKDYKRLLEQTRWIPVSERLPEPKKDVVVWTIQGNKPRYFVATLFPHKTYGYVWIGEEEIHLYPEQVLYWMPLPYPPVEDKNVGKEESHE